ncbi:unnamed protein product [Symbiodinium sp. CCMP2456]|nr:unnamed protein product [Symbiodinium sp. CCMP2456]
MEEHDLVSNDEHAENAAVAEPKETQESHLTALTLAERSLPDNSSKATSDSDAVAEQLAHSQDTTIGNEGAGRIPNQMHKVEDRIEATLQSSPSGTVSHDTDDLSRPRQSAHVVASARALMAADARSAAQAAVEAAAWQANPQLSGSSEIFSSPRRRAEEYLAGPSASQSTWRSGSEDGRRRWKTSTSNLVSGSSSLQSLPSVSRAGAGPTGASRAWHHGLSRRLAEVHNAVQDYRHRLLKSLGALSDVKSALHDADARRQQDANGAELLLPEVWEIGRALLDGDLAVASSMQLKAEEEAQLQQELKAKLRVSSAALEVEAVLGGCDELRGRIEEVQRRLRETRGRESQKLSKAQAHALIRSFTAVLLPQLPQLMQIEENSRTASEAAAIRFLHAANAAQTAHSDGSAAGPTGPSALAKARAARSRQES